VILAQISDPHLATREWAASDALARAVRAVLDLPLGPDAVLVSGDLADAAESRSYARAAELLGVLPMPVYVLGGNHDARDRLEAAFGPGAAGPWATSVGGVRLLGLDTVVPGADGGALGPDGLAWLESTLAASDEPAIVAMHHPPAPIGMDALDRIGLDPSDAREFASIVAASGRVVLVVCGHVHRTVFTSVGGAPLVCCPSTYLQARLELGGGPLQLIPEPPAMVLHVWRDGVMTSHVQPIV
jgi:3',5'-cyclic AMP phosphodiesterase CpdA